MATVKNNTDEAYKSPAHYKQHNKTGTYRRITTYPKTAVCIRIMSLLLAFIPGRRNNAGDCTGCICMV